MSFNTFKLLIERFGIYLLLSLALFILFYDSNKKFIGHHDWNSVVYSNIASNYNRYGFIKTKFGQVRIADESTLLPNGTNLYFTHYPPPLPVLIAISFRVLGESEVSARIVPIISSILMLIFIFNISKKISNLYIGLLAVIFTIVIPIFYYFGKLPVHETVLPSFTLGSVYFFLNYIESKRIKDYLLVTFFLGVSLLISWPGYYIVPQFVLYSLIFVKDREIKKKILLLIPFSIIFFILYLIHLKILTGSFFGGGLLDVFIFRANPYQSANIYGFTLVKFITTEIRYFIIYFTKILLFFSLIWLISFFYRLKKGTMNRLEAILFFLLLYGITHLLLFSNMAFIHDYMIYYTLPFITISSSLVIYKLVTLVKTVYRPIIIIILILVVAKERLNFGLTLLKTHEHYRGYLTGEFIRKHTNPGELSFVGSNHFEEFDGGFIGYYAKRNVHFGETNLVNEHDYRLIIRPKLHDALSKEIKEKLDITYIRSENQNFIWYDTNNLR